jgi:hypothetical protein
VDGERFGGGLGVHDNSLAVSVELGYWSHHPDMRVLVVVLGPTVV